MTQIKGVGFGLGRRPAKDERDNDFPLRLATIGAEPTNHYRYWSYLDQHLNQGATSSCVGHSWAHFLEAAPIQHPEPGSIVDPFHVYREAQKVDEWAGENYQGTSVRAGAKVLAAEGFIGGYRWAFTLDEVTRHVWTTGPVVLGTTWYEAMFDPDPVGFVKIGGGVAGGHAYLMDGVNMQNHTVRCLNSWNENWGVARGRFRMTFDTLAELIADDGEAAMAIESVPDLVSG